jgi:nucleoside-diphosphate kinase
MIEASGFLISKMKMVKLQHQQAQYLFQYKSKSPFFKEEIDFLCSDFVTGIEVVGDNCV